MAFDVKRIDTVEAIDRNQWNHVVDQSELGCVYHRYDWIRAVEDGTSYEPRHLVISKKGNPISLLPTILTDVGPFQQLTSMVPGFGGPVVTTDEERCLELLLEGVSNLYDGSIYFSRIRTFDPNYARYHDIFTEYGYKVSADWCRFRLDLTRGWDALFDRMDRSRRRSIRSGHDQEYEVVDEDLTSRTMSSFYDAFSSVMDRVNEVYLPQSFFIELGELEEYVKLFSLMVNGSRRGQLLFILNEDQSAVHYSYSGVTEDDFEYNASELIHEHAIRWAIDQGYETYDFRAAPADFRDGLFKFKEQFGPQTLPLLTWERGYPMASLTAGRKIYRQLL